MNHVSPNHKSHQFSSASGSAARLDEFAGLFRDIVGRLAPIAGPDQDCPPVLLIEAVDGNVGMSLPPRDEFANDETIKRFYALVLPTALPAMKPVTAGLAVPVWMVDEQYHTGGRVSDNYQRIEGVAIVAADRAERVTGAIGVVERDPDGFARIVEWWNGAINEQAADALLAGLARSRPFLAGGSASDYDPC